MAQKASGTQQDTALEGVVLDEGTLVTITELTEVCQLNLTQIKRMVGEGLLHPRGARPEHWCFSGVEIQRARCALRLQRDLDLNLAGAALALELLEEIHSLRNRVRLLERHLGVPTDADL
jgi:chaperone modulatory protein CbpM